MIGLQQLSARECEVLALTADGLTTREIGYALYIAEATAKNHRATIRRKLGARTIAHAVAIGLRDGWID